MTTRSKEQVQEILGDYLPLIADVFRGAWEDWRTSPYASRWRTNRGRANFVWEQIISRASVVFANDPRVRMVRKHETFLFLLDDVLAFRFKKSDEAGLTSNVPTQAAIAFHDPERDIPGLPQVDRVDIVYILNRVQTAIADILVVGRHKTTVAWSFSALPQSNVVAIGAPAMDDAPAERPALRLVRVKSTPKSDAARDKP